MFLWAFLTLAAFILSLMFGRILLALILANLSILMFGLALFYSIPGV